MATPAPNPDHGAGGLGDGDTGGSSSGKRTGIPISSLLRSTPAPTFPSRQTESASPQDQNTTTQDTGEASTTATESASPCAQDQNPTTQDTGEASTAATESTSTSEPRCPPFLSFTDKMIVADGMKRLWEFSDVDTYMNATYILRRDAHNHPEGPRIWKEEFIDGARDTYVRSKALLVYHNLFSQEAWKELYICVMKEFPELREVPGETDVETIQNLRLWDEWLATIGKKERTPEEQEQLKAWEEAEMMEWGDDGVGEQSTEMDSE